ncbi:MAG: ATP-binding protein [Clostridia bacterium]|nr:ATP-binding protein [Clostridia bacterium]
MVKVIIGEKGSGKTNALLKSVQSAVERDHGSVVFINNNKRHVLDLNYKVRMIDTSEFDIANFEELYGLVSGVISQNYDITHIFVDSITKIANGDVCDIEKYLDRVAKIADKFNIEVLMTISMSENSASDGIKKYLA